ncbi:MAG: DUF3169 family protein [Tolypothrix carrinoi HA7290-LM1]|jgi:uncharacterized membrane protein YeaQ/YmgE (transglycosylase-associated protein family)|nr:DUF3169 family protein [Tolypothrix carrinoi HA7290-LM1]
MSRWAVIVYGRTYEVDFRFLALPHDFNRAEQDWTMAHIQTMTRLAEDLPGKPRWAVFKNDKLCVVGVACMARDLGSQVNTNDEEDITRDQRGRPLYTFVGYATRLGEQDVVEIPDYLNKNLSLFSRPYYEYVSVNWRVKSYDSRSSVAIPTDYQDCLPTVEIPADLNRREFSLNVAEDDAVYLWCDREEERHYLWTAAAEQIRAGHNVSLCLGLALRNNAINGAFLNATAADVAAKEKIIRIQERTPVSLPDSASKLSEPTPNLQSPGSGKHKIVFILLQVSAGIIGAICGFLVARILKLGTAKVAVYTFVGGVIAWILLLLAFAVNLLVKNNSSVKPRFHQNDRDSNVSSSNQDRMLGFRDKTEQDRTEEDDFMGWR